MNYNMEESYTHTHTEQKKTFVKKIKTKANICTHMYTPGKTNPHSGK